MRVANGMVAVMASNWVLCVSASPEHLRQRKLSDEGRVRTPAYQRGRAWLHHYLSCKRVVKRPAHPPPLLPPNPLQISIPFPLDLRASQICERMTQRNKADQLIFTICAD